MILTRGIWRAPIILVTCLLINCASKLANADSLRVVALSGQSVPGAAVGTQFQSFSELNLNDSGQTAFLAALKQGTGDVTASNNNGVWSEGSGTLSVVARQGSQAPNAPTGAVFSSFDTPRLDNDGRIAFDAHLLDGSGGVDATNDDVLYSQLSGPLSLYLREGDPVPGLPAGSQFGNFNFPVTSSGHLAFFGGLKIGPGGVQNITNRTNWSADASGLRLVAHEGDPAPGTPVGTLFDVFFSPNVNSSGAVTFDSETRSNAFSGQRGGVWADSNGALTKVAYYGEPAPGTPTTFRQFYTPLINDSGQVAFLASLQGVSFLSGIWLYDSDALHPLVVLGDPAPDVSPAAQFASFNRPDLSNSGQVAFLGTLATAANVTSSNADGVFAVGGSASRLIARTGNQAPGTLAGDTFAFFNSPAINAMGQVAFLANLNVGVGDVTNANKQGIWAEDKAGILRLIARTGDTLDVDSGPGVDLRMIVALLFIDLAGNVGPPDTFNDQGELAFIATFTDGSSAVIVSSVAAVPEPNAALVAVTLLVIGTSQRKSRRVRFREAECQRGQSITSETYPAATQHTSL